MDPLVSVDWLQENIGRDNIVILQADLPAAVSATSTDSEARVQIPGSLYVDLNQQFCDTSSALPHMLSSPEQFADEAQRLGICRQHTIIVYDKFGVYASPRLRVAFKAMGHDNVAILDGGLPAWIEAGGNTEPIRLHNETPRGNFIAQARTGLFCNATAILDVLSGREKAEIIDARSSARYNGTAAEPRPGLRAGHIPNSKNIPFDTVLIKGKMKSRDELRAVFGHTSQVDSKLIFSCGSGVTACIPALAAEVIGLSNVCIYDGSWSGWGADSTLPVEKG